MLRAACGELPTCIVIILCESTEYGVSEGRGESVDRNAEQLTQLTVVEWSDDDEMVYVQWSDELGVTHFAGQVVYDLVGECSRGRELL